MDKNTSSQNLELSKILAKVMQCSYKRQECQEIMESILEMVEDQSAGRTDEEKIRNLRNEFEEIRAAYYNL